MPPPLMNVAIRVVTSEKSESENSYPTGDGAQTKLKKSKLAGRDSGCATIIIICYVVFIAFKINHSQHSNSNGTE